MRSTEVTSGSCATAALKTPAIKPENTNRLKEYELEIECFFMEERSFNEIDSHCASRKCDSISNMIVFLWNI